MREPKSITCSEFYQLTLQEKAGLLQRDGVYIGKLNKEGFIVLLYQLEDFYVEVFYIEFRGQINHFNCSKDVSLLDQYFDSEK